MLGFRCTQDTKRIYWLKSSRFAQGFNTEFYYGFKEVFVFLFISLSLPSVTFQIDTGWLPLADLGNSFPLFTAKCKEYIFTQIAKKRSKFLSDWKLLGHMPGLHTSL